MYKVTHRLALIRGGKALTPLYKRQRPILRP